MLRFWVHGNRYRDISQDSGRTPFVGLGNIDAGEWFDIETCECFIVEICECFGVETLKCFGVEMCECFGIECCESFHTDKLTESKAYVKKWIDVKWKIKE